ncbi:MAG: hypothetical protein LBV34_14215 [Nocardiopsaceae bacterium]|nr:hypothetical protein [Nocardiopsaceae bacterium]
MTARINPAPAPPLPWQTPDSPGPALARYRGLGRWGIAGRDAGECGKIGG